MDKVLVVMAAGLGSRYGGVKQIERLGPGGEILMEYAIYDAIQAGYNKIIIIIKPEMREDMDEVLGNRIRQGTDVPLCYAFQPTEGVWNGIELPKRKKPLGTVHALLCAAPEIDRPFAVINADDFYGAETLREVGKALDALTGPAETVMAAYRLKNTVSPFGTVTRGVCGIENGFLQTVTETYKIRLYPDGSIRDTSGGEDGPLLAPDTPVSMNLWGYHPGILSWMEARFTRFLQELPPDDPSGECLLPVVMDEFIHAGTLRCAALPTGDQWFGLTYPDDKAGVVAALRELHENGSYPPKLWVG